MRKNITLSLENILLRLRIILSHSRNITRHLTEKEKIILSSLLIITLSSINILSASALEYQSNTNIEFTFNSTISVSITGEGNGNLSIDDLTPGSYSDSNIITVSVSSNAVSGYSLGSTVGSSTNASNELRKDGTDTTNKFNSISTNKASLSAFDNNSNTWGYSYSTDSGSTWQSGDITNSPLTGYNGLPVYTTESPIKLINSTTSGSSSIQFKIGARATNTQVSGEYSNIINFIGLANPNPEPIYMQNATLADCGQDMVDIRDYNVYSTAEINGQCWMTQNLHFTGTSINAENSNVTSDRVITWKDLTLDPNCTYISSSSASMTTTCSKIGTDNNGNITAWYNYSGATAENITGNNNSTNATESICPKNWSLPSLSDFSNITSRIDVFSPTYGGYYVGGTLNYTTTYGFWWASTANGGTMRYRLYFNNGNVGTNADLRYYGFYVRCVMKTPN